MSNLFEGINVSATVVRTLVSLTSLTLLLAGCDSTDRDWDEATQLDTKVAYLSFLEEHPTGDLATQALQRIESLDWEAAVAAQSEVRLEQFLTDHPNGRFADQARRLRDWMKAVRLDAREAYSSFVENHPAAEQSVEALERIDTLEWELVLSEGTAARLQQYLTDYPNGQYADEARIRIEELSEYRDLDPSEFVCSFRDVYYEGSIVQGGAIEPFGGEIGSFLCRLPNQDVPKEIPLSRNEFAEGGIVTRDFGVFKVLFSQRGGASMMLTGIQKEQLNSFLSE